MASDQGGVTFVNRFALHGDHEEFERAFAETSRFMAAQPGFHTHTLLRRADDAAGTGTYVNIAHWADEESFRAALAHPAFAGHAAALRALSTSEPALYRPRLQQEAAR